MKTLTLALVAAFSGMLTSPALFAGQDPDLAKEAKFHKIFKTYNEQPTSDEAWKTTVSKGRSQNYQVQKKDTLWGASQTLFGDANYWPKIWSLNGDEVLNPHEIFPDQQIHFVEGTFGEPPTLAVKDGMPEEQPGPEPTPQVAEAPPVAENRPVQPDGEVADSEVPESKIISTKLNPLPRSLPDWEALTGMADFKMNVKPVPEAPSNLEQTLEFYISEKSSNVEGLISETEAGMKVASDRQLVYIKFNQPPTRSRYVIIEEMDQVPDPWQQKQGRLMHVLGELEVIEIANPSKNIYRARPIHNFTHFNVGSLVVATDIPVYTTGVDSEGGQLSAQIIGGAYDSVRHIFGPNEIVFLNSGSSNGVVAGQSYAVYKNQKLRNSETEVEINPPIIGRVKVIQVTELFATALVTEVSDELRVGDSLDTKLSDFKP